MPDPISKLRSAVEESVAALRDGEGGDARPTFERPPRPEMGDYSTNAAMLLAPTRGEQPRTVAEELRVELGGRLEGTAERIEVAGPGFINLFLADGWHRGGVEAILGAGEALGAGSSGGERINLEFVSANPTGPLTAAGGRHAAYGDSVARVLELAGSEVEREYYLNDTGGQMRRFAESIAARMQGTEPSEDGYEGAYIEELAREFAEQGIAPDDLEALERLGAERMVEGIRKTLERFGVHHDTWSSERALYDSGLVERALAELRERGHVYESEGATWLRSTEFGDDKDRVLLRSGGEPTYLAADIAYHRDKLERGAERLIDVVGADHHGYMPRVRAALAAIGADPDRFEALIMQLVHVVERGERSQMSKRRGDFVTLDELIDDIGTDAARFLVLQRSHDTTVDLDLDLARSQSQDNPVYYVQYAHARIASILRKAGDERVEAALAAQEAARSSPAEPSERDLIKRLLELPDQVRDAAELRAPHRLCAYSMATAADFHAFYRDCQVVGAEGEGIEAARIAVCVATRRVIARTLELLGVSAPEQM